MGTSLKNWKTVIRNGGNATTVFDGTIRELRTTYGDAWMEVWNNLAYNQINHYRTSGWMYTLTGWGDLDTRWMPSDMETSANDQALLFLYRRIRSERTKMQGLTFLGEGREALRMLKSPVRALRQGLSNYIGALSKRKVPRMKTAQAKKVLADTWLEYSFGWAPLLNDIGNAIIAYQSFLAKTHNQRISATGKQELQVYSGDIPSAYGQIPVIGSRLDFWRCTVRYTCGLKAITYGSELEEGMDKFGLTLKQFIPTAWELLPWSFLIDYFANIGELIEAAVTNTSDVTWICKTVRKERVQVTTYRLNDEQIKASLTLYRGSGGSPGYTAQTFRTVARRPLTSVPFPSFQVRLPGSNLQIANLAALAASAKKLLPFF